MSEIKEHYIKFPATSEDLKDLQMGDICYISGTIYTARDAAHKLITEAIKNGEETPFNMKDQCIYYVGPCPAKEGQVIGSCGPTTAKRMDAYTPMMLENGIRGIIAKGPRNNDVVEAIIKNKAVYFAAVGGAGALASKSVKKAELIAYPELLAEAVYKLEVENLFTVVAIDSKGNNIYDR